MAGTVHPRSSLQSITVAVGMLLALPDDQLQVVAHDLACADDDLHSIVDYLGDLDV